MTFDLQARDKFSGLTVAEYIETVPGELPIDAVGLWQIVPTGRYGYELADAELTEFVRRCVFALLESGAKPVVGGGGTEYDWILELKYGVDIKEVADAVVQEWLSTGAGDTDPGGLWFASPSPYVGKRK